MGTVPLADMTFSASIQPEMHRKHAECSFTRLRVELPSVMQVVMNAKVAKVTLWNNKTYNAILWGVEPDKDLALLKI
jgi:hypothetical protein